MGTHVHCTYAPMHACSHITKEAARLTLECPAKEHNLSEDTNTRTRVGVLSTREPLYVVRTFHPPAPTLMRRSRRSDRVNKFVPSNLGGMLAFVGCINDFVSDLAGLPESVSSRCQSLAYCQICQRRHSFVPHKALGLTPTRPQHGHRQTKRCDQQKRTSNVSGVWCKEHGGSVRTEFSFLKARRKKNDTEYG